MIEIQNNKILLDGKELQFDNKIIEAAEYEGKVVIVFETDEDGGYDNVFCYTQDLQLLWRIKPAPVAIGGTARSPYVGVDIVEGNCRAIDFYGRRFKVKIGQSVSAVNYMTGDTYEGTISEISNVPSDSVNYYGDSNPNSSFYEYTAYIENPQNLKKGDSLELTIDTSSEGSDSALYIYKSYVRTENGQSYIYKDDNGKLKKQSVKTGKSLWGSYVEIKSGLTNDDYIAFPYGVREGEKTKVSEDCMY